MTKELKQLALIYGVATLSGAASLAYANYAIASAIGAK